MRADNSAHIIAAARRRSDDARRRAVTALRRLDADGQPVTFSTVASAAGVSRSWLYAQDDLREQIGRLRTRQQHAPSSPPVPDWQRATPASLLRRLEEPPVWIICVLESREPPAPRRTRSALGEQRAAAIRSPATTRPESREQNIPAGLSGKPREGP